MRGKLLDFSILTTTGIIMGEDQQRYAFAGREWKGLEFPMQGMIVEFEVNEAGQAINIDIVSTSDTLFAPSPNIAISTAKLNDHYSTIDWFVQCTMNYINGSGRAGRREYWSFQLIYFILILLGFLVGNLLNLDSQLGICVIVGLLCPHLAVSVRRLHDLDKSGWWLLLGLLPIIGYGVLLIWFMQAGDPAINRFGDTVRTRQPV